MNFPAPISGPIDAFPSLAQFYSFSSKLPTRAYSQYSHVSMFQGERSNDQGPNRMSRSALYTQGRTEKAIQEKTRSKFSNLHFL